MGRLAKFWFMTRREKAFLCEAGILLLLSNACVKAIAFRRIDKFLRTRWNNGIEGRIGQEQEIRLVRRSISRAANVLPWKSLCLSRSIAEYVMLRRRGIQPRSCLPVRDFLAIPRLMLMPGLKQVW